MKSAGKETSKQNSHTPKQPNNPKQNTEHTISSSNSPKKNSSSKEEVPEDVLRNILS